MAATVQPSGRWYTWREHYKVWARGLLTGVTTRDDHIDALIIAISKFIESETDRIFIPWTGTKTFDYQGTSQLILGDDLISVTSITDDDAAIASSDYFLYPRNAPSRNKPYLWVELLFTSELFQFDDTKQAAISINGKWGYNERTRASGSLLNGAISDTTSTSVIVDSGDDFDIGQTILVDSEQMFIRNRDTGSETLTVERGMNGTTAATHSDNAVVYIIEPEPQIKYAANVLVARNIQRSDTAWSNMTGDEARFQFSQTIPGEVKSILEHYRRLVYEPVRLMDRDGTLGRYTW